MCFGHCSPHLWSHPRSYVFTHVQTSLFRDHWNGQVHFLRKEVWKPFSVSFFPTKIISKGDLWVKLGVGYFNSCWNLLLPFWHVQWEFFPTVYSPALSCEKNAFRSFSSHIREGHYESQWAWGLGDQGDIGQAIK